MTPRHPGFLSHMSPLFIFPLTFLYLLHPSVDADRDWYGGTQWFEYMVDALHGQAKRHATTLLWIETNGSKRTLLQNVISSSGKERVPTLRIVSFASDPFGWNRIEDDDSAAVYTLEDLDRALHVIENTVADLGPAVDDSSSSLTSYGVPIVIESLTPLIMRHGFFRTRRFLQQLLRETSYCSARICRLRLAETNVVMHA